MHFPDRGTFIKTAGGSLLGGLAGALLGGLAGYLASKLQDPTGWSDIIFTLTGVVLGYGSGAGIGAFFLHQHLGGKKTFARAFFSALTGLFLMIFLSEPLHLNQMQPLMWALVIILPPISAAIMLPVIQEA